MKPIIKQNFWRRMIRIESEKGESEFISFNYRDIDKVKEGTVKKVLKGYVGAISDQAEKDEMKKELQRNLLNADSPIYLDTVQPTSLARYWYHEFIEQPHWDEMTTEGYNVGNCLLLWTWKGNKRLYPAYFTSSFPDNFNPKTNTQNFINEGKKALLCDGSGPDLTNCKITAYYTELKIKAANMAFYTKHTKRVDRNWFQIADVLYSIQYKVFPYTEGHLCDALPLPGDKIGSVRENRVNCAKVRTAMERLNKIWNNPKANIIYISGDPGSGKEGYCKSIHYGKGRSGEEPPVVDMTNQDEKQMHKQLFGEMINGHHYLPGKIELAEKGTLILDELNKSNSTIRGKLLRPLESKEYYPHASSHLKEIKDVVFVLASPDEYKQIIEQDFTKNEIKKRWGPADLWSRIDDHIHIQNPFRISKNDANNSAELPDIIENLFSLLWIKCFCGILKVKDTKSINSLLRRSGDKKCCISDHCQPHEYAVANTWRKYVYAISVNEEGIIVNIKKGTIFQDASKLFKKNSIVKIKSLFENKSDDEELKICSIRDFRNKVNKIASSIYEEANEDFNLDFIKDETELLWKV